MTPPAITTAGRGGGTKPRSAAKGATRTAGKASTGPAAKGDTRADGHRRKLRQQPAPRAPRRVSGPLGGRIPAPVAASPARIAEPITEHVRRAPRPRPASSRRRAVPLGARAIAFVRALPDHALLDRVVRGRAWIPLLGVMLAGIVAMQVEVLKLGAGIGRSIQLSTALQSRNELLRARVATLADDQRIESLAASGGMVMPAPTDVAFLSAQTGADAQRAAANIHPPDATAFIAALPSTATSASATTSTSTATSIPTATSTPTAPSTAAATTGTPVATAPTPIATTSTTPTGG